MTGMRATRTVTLKDVASRVGVTAAAVSMALSGSPRISAATAERIREAAADLGYVPSSAAKALRNQRSDAIAVIVPNSTQHVFGHAYFMHVLTGVSAVANDHDLQVLVSTSSSEASGLTAYERVMRSRTADGAIITSAAIGDPNIGRLAASGLPIVLLGDYPDLPEASSVGWDDRGASAAATEHLVREHGRRRLLHVTGPLDHRAGLDRRDGFLDAVRRTGAAGTVHEGDFSEASGAAAVDAALAAGDPPDGVVFANDDMAFGGLLALRRAGLAVPADVSVVGFDDFGLARIVEPALTTMHVEAEEVARIAARRLLERIDAPDAPPTRDALPVTLVARASCGCPAGEPALSTT